MKRIYVVVAVLLFPITLFSKTLNPVVMESETLRLHRNIMPVLIRDAVVYYQTLESENQIWIHSFQHNSKVKLHSFSADEGRVINMKRVDNSIVFVKGNSVVGHQLWESDLSIAGTKRIGDFQVAGNSSKVIDGLHFTVALEPRRLVSYDGQRTVEYLLNTSRVPDNLCVFTQENIIAAYLTIRAETVISQATVDSIVDLTSALPEGFRLADPYLDETIQINDQCFIKIYNSDTRERDYLVFSSNGSVERASEIEVLQGYRKLFLIGSNLYAVVGNSLIKFTNDVTGIEIELDLDSISPSIFLLSTLKSSKHSMTIEAVCADCSPAIPVSHTFNADLELISGTAAFEVRLFSQNTADIMLLKSRYNRNLYQLIYPDGLIISNRAIDISEVIVNSDQDGQAVIFGTEVISGYQVIYATDAAPDIGQQINGPWHNPEYKNQGFNFYRGIRVDGSHYLNVTGFFYFDGAPYWLAGVGEISFPQKSIEINLSEYEGIDFLEAEAQPAVTPIGSLSLKFTDCDTISAELTTIYGDYAIDLSRINDFVFKDYCVN